MRNAALTSVAAVAALALSAPFASADPICKQIGKDGFGSDVCAEAVVNEDGVYVWVGCDIGTVATCAIRPITVPPR